MNSPASQPPLTIRQNRGIGLRFGILSAVPFLGWTFAIRSILARRDFNGLDILTIGTLVILMTAAGVAWNRGNLWAAIRTLPADRRPPAPKPPSWIDQVRESSRLAWVLIGYAAISYLITVAGLIALILMSHDCSCPPPELLPVILYLLLTVWGVGVFAVGIALFRRLAARWGLATISLVGGAGPVHRLWDRDTDQGSAGESRSST